MRQECVQVDDRKSDVVDKCCTVAHYKGCEYCIDSTELYARRITSGHTAS
jgi:hypothetical protein